MPGNLLNAAVNAMMGSGNILAAVIGSLEDNSHGVRQSSHSRQTEASGSLAHFRVGNFFSLRERLIGGGENHVLHDLSIRWIQCLRINLDGHKRTITARNGLHRAAAAGRLDRASGEARLNLFHLLLHFGSLLHEFSDAGHFVGILFLVVGF